MKKGLIVFILLLVAGGVAFTTVGGGTLMGWLGLRDSEDVLRSRVEKYWEARLVGDVSAMTALILPEHGGMISPGLMLTENYEIHEIEIDGETANAHIAVTARINHALMAERTREVLLQDRWVLSDGTWYRDAKPQSLGQMIKSSNQQGAVEAE
ncbi:MAG: hypothetical protein GY716_10845 [bacterium]|nr:hypothetical protein [bacterium]